MDSSALPLTRRALLASAGLLAVSACSSRPGSPSGATRGTGGPSASGLPSPSEAAPTRAITASPTTPAPATAAEMAARATVPVLCYHQLRDWRPSDKEYARRFLICPPATFRAQLDTVQAAGFTTITPNDHLDHLTTGAALPSMPIILSFDDAQGSQSDVAFPELVRRELTGTFFAMTVVLDKPDWLSRTDLQSFAASGMTIAAHTWDHHRVDRYTEPDWALQLEQPRELLEGLLKTPVEHFVYPYGAWNADALPHVQAAGYRTAYQLTDKPLDVGDPLHTLRRVLVDSTWTGPQLLAAMDASVVTG